MAASAATGFTAAAGRDVPDQLPMGRVTYGCSAAAWLVAHLNHVPHSLPLGTRYVGRSAA